MIPNKTSSLFKFKKFVLEGMDIDENNQLQTYNRDHLETLIDLGYFGEQKLEFIDYDLFLYYLVHDGLLFNNFNKVISNIITDSDTFKRFLKDISTLDLLGHSYVNITNYILDDSFKLKMKDVEGLKLIFDLSTMIRTGISDFFKFIDNIDIFKEFLLQYPESVFDLCAKEENIDKNIAELITEALDRVDIRLIIEKNGDFFIRNFLNLLSDKKSLEFITTSDNLTGFPQKKLLSLINEDNLKQVKDITRLLTASIDNNDIRVFNLIKDNLNIKNINLSKIEVTDNMKFEIKKGLVEILSIRSNVNAIFSDLYSSSLTSNELYEIYSINKDAYCLFGSIFNEMILDDLFNNYKESLLILLVRYCSKCNIFIKEDLIRRFISESSDADIEFLSTYLVKYMDKFKSSTEMVAYKIDITKLIEIDNRFYSKAYKRFIMEEGLRL